MPVLRFGPAAWAKLLFLQRAGDSEVGGFGVSDPDDPLRIVEFATVRQQATVCSVALEDQAIAEFFEQQVQHGRQPEQFARVWIHTHPGSSPQPSGTDEHTFARVFGFCHWAVMFILARGGQSYARLRFNVGPGGELLIPVQVDYTQPFAASDHAAWREEYLAHIQPGIVPPALACPAQGSAIGVGRLEDEEEAAWLRLCDQELAEIQAQGEEVWP